MTNMFPEVVPQFVPSCGVNIAAINSRVFFL